MSSAKKPDYTVPALEKGLDIIEALSQAKTPMTQSELAHQLGRSSSELFRMLDCLEKRRYLIKDPTSGTYDLSLHLYALAHRRNPQSALLEASRIPLMEFVRQTGESIHISVLDRHRLLVLTQTGTHQPVQLSIQPGSSFEPLLTASGRLLLAHMPEEELNAWLKEDSTWKQAGSAQHKLWLKNLASIRLQHFSSAQDETVRGTEDLAVLVSLGSPAQQAALACSFLAFQRDEKKNSRVQQQLLICARMIETNLGLNFPSKK
jgi:DNA-binding IclR family transcriptional regulator